MIRSFLISIFYASMIFAQPLAERYSHLGELYLPAFSSSLFPDQGRKDGHTYNNKTYPFNPHYCDSTVAVFVPNGFIPTGETDLVIWFHGWYANIDTACSKFRLIDQFAESGKNAVFVFPEGPRNSPDSYGGKLEKKDGLKLLVGDVLEYLKTKGKINSAKPGRIILAGHSGAYRVIAYCLMRGGLTEHVSDVLLFDGLYAETEKFAHWIATGNGRFINIYTDDGGTKNESEDLLEDMDGWGIDYYKTEEKDLDVQKLKGSRVVFIHTDLTHNEVIAERGQFLSYLKTSGLRDKQ